MRRAEWIAGQVAGQAADAEGGGRCRRGGAAKQREMTLRHQSAAGDIARPRAHKEMYRSDEKEAQDVAECTKDPSAAPGVRLV